MVRDILGKAPEATEYGEVEWPQMPLETTDEPYTMAQAEEDKRKQNPRWTPTFTSPMDAPPTVSTISAMQRAKRHALCSNSPSGRPRSRCGRGGIGGGVIAPYSVRREDLRLQTVA